MPKASGKPVAVLPVPKPTPTASPSGMLCSVIAIDEQPDPPQAVGLRTLAAFDEMLVWDQQIQPPETGRPQQNSSTDHTPARRLFKRRQDQGEEDVASMTPAAKPSRAFCTRLETLRTSRRGKAPKPVAAAGREAG